MLITRSPTCGSKGFALTAVAVRAALQSFLWAASSSPAHQPLGDSRMQLWSHITVNPIKGSNWLMKRFAKPRSPRRHKIQKCLLASRRPQHRVRTSSSAEGSAQAMDSSLSDIATNWEHVVSDCSPWGKGCNYSLQVFRLARKLQIDLNCRWFVCMEDVSM